MEKVTTHYAISRLISDSIAKIRVANPAKIVSYDSAKQTAQVEVQTKTRVEETPPELMNIPVIWPRGGDGYLIFPIKKGDSGLLITCDVDIGYWREVGQQVDPGDIGRNEIAFSVFYPGLAPNSEALPDTGGSKTVLAGSAVHVGSPNSLEEAVLGTAWASFMNGFLTTLKQWVGEVNAGIPAGVAPLSGPAMVALVQGYSDQFSNKTILSEKIKLEK